MGAGIDSCKTARFTCCLRLCLVVDCCFGLLGSAIITLPVGCFDNGWDKPGGAAWREGVLLLAFSSGENLRRPGP